jgi:hypothetical protein
VIPIIFYIVVAAARLDLGALRQAGWLFDMGNSADSAWYEFYTYFGEALYFFATLQQGLILYKTLEMSKWGRFGPLFPHNLHCKFFSYFWR